MFNRNRTSQGNSGSKDGGADEARDEPEAGSTPQDSDTATQAASSGSRVLALNKPSIISAGFDVVGDITSQGVLQVEGSIRGNLRLNSVTIGATGRVEGTLECETLFVKGAFKGIARCQELSLSAGAFVEGRVQYDIIALQRGAVVKGELLKQGS